MQHVDIVQDSAHAYRRPQITKYVFNASLVNSNRILTCRRTEQAVAMAVVVLVSPACCRKINTDTVFQLELPKRTLIVERD